MAAKKPKTPWGRAYSAAFKTLKSEWDRKGTVNGVRVGTWKTAFKAIGKLARKKADGKHKNPIAGKRKATSRKQAKTPKRSAKRTAAKKAKPRKTATKRARPAGRIFSVLNKTRTKPAPKPSPRTELVVVKIAGGELTNTSTQAATMRRDGSREVVTGGTWVPTASTIGKARKLREQLMGKGVRFSRITVLVDGRKQDRKRKGRARFADGKLYLE